LLSIITAIYNQRSMNELYWENLNKYTHYKFELIIIDNGSTDGSAEFFETVGAKVIRNGANYSYPYCQNRGIEVSQYDWLAFLNNDIIVSPHWDKHILENMLVNELDVATVCGVEQLETKDETRKLHRRWNKIKLILSIFGQSKLMLSTTHKLMYKNWELFCEQRYLKFKHKIRQGFVGNTVVMKRGVIDKIGLWDERFQSADYDLYFRTLERVEKFGDMKPVHICLDTFVHHYIRLTVKQKYPPFADQENLISVTDKWGISILDDYVALMAN
jgi:GT2 family glycosyltransferase